MSKKEELTVLFQNYEKSIIEEDAKISYFKKLLSGAGSLPTARITEDFLKNVENLLKEVPTEETEEVFTTVLEKGSQRKDDRYIGLSFIAIQTFLLPLVGQLQPAQAAGLYTKMQELFPKRYRTPVTEKLLKQLKAAGEQ